MLNQKEKNFEIKKVGLSNDSSREQNRKLLWETWDLLLSKNNSSNKQKIKCQQKKKTIEI